MKLRYILIMMGIVLFLILLPCVLADSSTPSGDTLIRSAQCSAGGLLVSGTAFTMPSAGGLTAGGVSDTQDGHLLFSGTCAPSFAQPVPVTLDTFLVE